MMDTTDSDVRVKQYIVFTLSGGLKPLLPSVFQGTAQRRLDGSRVPSASCP